MEHHPVADLFPMLPDDELKELAADIKERGQLQPIVLDTDGRILDGRNRHAACEMVGVEPKFETYDGDDPDGYALAVNIARRHLTTGARAIIAAKAAKMIGHGGQKVVAMDTGISNLRISDASVVLDWAPDQADAVITGAKPLSVAVEGARERKREAEALKAKQERLHEHAADLLSLVEEGRMAIDDAVAALDAREEKARQEAAERAAQEAQEEQRRAAAKQEALNAWSQCNDALTQALSYANTYTPPPDMPSNYRSVAAFLELAEELTDIARSWRYEQ